MALQIIQEQKHKNLVTLAIDSNQELNLLLHLRPTSPPHNYMKAVRYKSLKIPI